MSGHEFCFGLLGIAVVLWVLHQIVDLIWPGDHRRRDHGPGNNAFTQF